MSAITKAQVEAALSQVIDPHVDENPVAGKSVKKIDIDGGRVSVKVELGYPAKGFAAEFAEQLRARVAAIEGVSEAHVDVAWKVAAHTFQKGVQAIEGIKNIIAVASGKGGVGKSTLAVNLALALSAEGANVGILDADIYGPSQPRMLGVNSRPESKDGRRMEPLVSYHLQSMSIGFLVDEDTPMIWRGPMVTQALEQLLRDTHWQDLDYLVIDLPPGTGDIQLTLAQRVPVSGAIIVTTPQDIALLDARKAYKMFEKVEVPVLGVVENMSTHICSKCGHEEHIFGQGGGMRMAEDYDINFLGSVPLDIRIREDTDGGKPTVVAEPDSQISRTYREIARRAAARLSQQKKDFTGAFPSIVIDNN